MSESTQHKLSRVRPPRVQITYDVETGNAIQKKELPFVVGIMADLSKKAVADNTPLQERAFVEIDRDNFGAVMAQLKPKLAVKVADAQGEDDAILTFDLEFASLDDFRPEALVGKLDKAAEKKSAVMDLWTERLALRDMLTKLDGNDALLAKLSAVVADKARLEALLKSASERKTDLETKQKTLAANADTQADA